ncbi:MAG: PP2C family protein-serine/threonine phosphatase, partial [Acidimicrobiia bacterium]
GQFLAVVTLALAGVVLAAFAYGERDLSRFLLGRGEIGLPGAIGSILLGWSVVLSRPQDPLLRPLVSANLGGKLLRWLVPLALLAPVGLISLVRVQAQFDTPGILAMLAISFSVVLLAGLIYASRQVDLFATRGRLAEDQASRATDTLTQVAPVVSDLVDTLHLVSVKRVHRVEIATRHIPALGFLAGDSLTVFPIGNDDIGLVMVDAAGHGAGPALHSLRIRDCLSQSMRLGASPAVAIEELRWLVTTSDTTATAAVVRVDGLTGRVIYALAGHPPPLVDRNGRFEQEQAGGPLLHPQARGEWVDRVVPLDTGNHFVVFTDGVADVFTSSTGHDEFTSLSGYLSHHPPRSGEELADSCIDFSSKRARVDDAAVAVVSLGPPDGRGFSPSRIGV